MITIERMFQEAAMIDLETFNREHFTNGLRVKEIAAKYEVKESYLWSWLRKRGIKVHQENGRTPRRVSKLDADEVRRDHHENGIQVVDLAKKLGYTKGNLVQFMNKHGIAFIDHRLITLDKFYAIYSPGMKMCEVAELLGVSPAKVSRFIAEHGLRSKLGIRPGPDQSAKTSEWDEWAKKIRWRRDVLLALGSACVECGSTECLAVHHIIPRSVKPELSLTVENGVPLCFPCHAKTFKHEMKFAVKYAAITGMNISRYM